MGFRGLEVSGLNTGGTTGANIMPGGSRAGSETQGGTRPAGGAEGAPAAGGGSDPSGRDEGRGMRMRDEDLRRDKERFGRSLWRLWRLAWLRSNGEKERGCGGYGGTAAGG